MPHCLIGKKITAVWIADDKGALRFDVDNGESIIARADGDCCSHTWIEELDNVDALIGGTVTSVEDIPMPQLTSRNDDEYDVIAYYGCRITTDKGYCTIDYRNSSNGYYGGNLAWPDDEYFYGGVFNQNVSSMNWRPLSV